VSRHRPLTHARRRVWPLAVLAVVLTISTASSANAGAEGRAALGPTSTRVDKALFPFSVRRGMLSDEVLEQSARELTAGAAPTATNGADAKDRPSNRFADRVGFTSHTNYLSEDEGGRYLERATSIGVRWFREDFWWSVLEPQRGQFNWAPTDALMRNAARHGANVVAIAGYAPGWASGRTESDKFPPRDPQDYARFCVAIVERYGERGSFWAENPSLRPAPVRAIELWNEPWFWAFWGPDPDPAGYASLVRAAAPAIKAASRDVRVLISGDLHTGYRDGRENSWLNGWLSQLLKQDLPMQAVDGWSIHPYAGNRGPYQSTIEGFADQRYATQWLFEQLPLIRDMTAAAGKFKPLWPTEFGWTTAGEVTEEAQARFVREAFTRTVDEWGAFVERSFLYVLERPHNGDRDGGFSLLRDDGSPKPGWAALSSLLNAS
jgi:polysaccharide biosynthesis protein PslG